MVNQIIYCLGDRLGLDYEEIEHFMDVIYMFVTFS